MATNQTNVTLRCYSQRHASTRDVFLVNNSQSPPAELFVYSYRSVYIWARVCVSNVTYYLHGNSRDSDCSLTDLTTIDHMRKCWDGQWISFLIILFSASTCDHCASHGFPHFDKPNAFDWVGTKRRQNHVTTICN